MNSERIERQIVVRAPRTRVWRALSDSTEFGQWFGMRFSSPFSPGAVLNGVIVPTTANPAVAVHQKPYEGTPFDITIERMEPERHFSFSWHPGAIDPKVDYSLEPTTLVVFTLEEVPEGVRLTVTETGFDRIPLERRLNAFNSNEQGWAIAVTLIRDYLADAN